MIDIGKDLQDAFNDGYKQGKQDEWIPLKRKCADILTAVGFNPEYFIISYPDKNGHYLVTYREWSRGEYLPKFDNTKVKILRFHEGIFRLPKCIDKKAEKDMCREVLAWMPLPEPYEGEDLTDFKLREEQVDDN